MPLKRLLVILVTVILAAAVTVYVASVLAVTLGVEPGAVTYLIPALLAAALVWRLMSRS
jgi:F0F1-type ATP synthase assembly protein I